MDTSAAPREIYAQRLAERTQSLADSLRSRDRIGYLRLVAILGVALCLWYAFHGLNKWWIALPVAAFIMFVWWQARFERGAEHARRSLRFFERGVARLDNRWQGGGEDGVRFADPHHPYASDLDLFGHSSLFELLSTARTRGGEQRLADWLKSASERPAAIDQLEARHAAIGELRPMLDLREQIAVLGDDYRTGVNPDQLVAWSSAVARPFPIGMRLAVFVLGLAGETAFIWWIFTGFLDLHAVLGLVLAIAVEAALEFSIKARISEIVTSVEEPAKDLNLLSQLLSTIENQQFRAPLLVKIRKTIEIDGKPASQRIAHLRRLMDVLDSRENLFLRSVGALLLWSTQTAMAIENWRAANGRYVAGWLDAVNELEALSSLANYAWEHPEDPFPRFCTAEGPVFDAEEMGHPLLPEGKCIRNTIQLKTPLRMLVVSGSNMSGKSTLLRTIGVNTVLALAGAPVRAKRLALSRVSLGASIRTVDSLEEGHSRFMAEILRLKQILELPAPALFLLDELLGGTNSHDRALGSVGLIRALLDRGAIGLLTTHDLALSKIADVLAPAAANVHFEDRLENGRLVFDYRVRPGIVARSNALDLMRAVGLDV